MKGKNWFLLAAALVAIPAAFVSTVLIAYSLFGDIFHSTWKINLTLFTFVAAGLYLLWRMHFAARWQRPLALALYAPAMFFALAWLGLVIQFKFDDCMAQQAVAADRPKAGSG